MLRYAGASIESWTGNPPMNVCMAVARIAASKTLIGATFCSACALLVSIEDLVQPGGVLSDFSPVGSPRSQ